jgi:hypothetical protein
VANGSGISPFRSVEQLRLDREYANNNGRNVRSPTDAP